MAIRTPVEAVGAAPELASLIPTPAMLDDILLVAVGVAAHLRPARSGEVDIAPVAALPHATAIARSLTRPRTPR